jgi:radical SAM superfamily enzyme YgiQ (UPF0313 family)
VSHGYWGDLIPVADIYGLSTYTTTYHRTLEIANTIKQMDPYARTVAGGPHATALPESVAEDFDWVVIGEGETAILHLLDALDQGNSLSPIIRDSPILDLDSLPFPDYTLVDIRSYNRVVEGKPCLSILSSRGCPYQCVFCNSIVMGSHNCVRFRSASNVVQEVQQLKVKWGITSFRFQDDLFTLNLPRLRELAKMLNKRDIVYRCFGRVNLCNQEVAQLLYASGCRHIAFGVESGSPTILRRMQKGQTVADIRQGIAVAKAAGLIVRAYLMVGFPGETWDTIQQTVDLMLECLPHEFSVYPLIPYPGTLLYEQPDKFGITHINHEFSQYFQVRKNRGTGFVFETDTLDQHLIAEMREFVIHKLETEITWAGNSEGFK